MSLKPPVNPNASLGSGRLLYNAEIDFGAYGNGSHDDSVALNEGLTFVGDSGGGTVVLSAGTFIAENISVPTGVELLGMNGAILRLKDSSTQTLISTASGCADAAIRNLTLDGNSANVSSSNKGVILNGTRIVMENCYLHDVEHDGVYVNPNANFVSVRNNRINTTGRYGVTIGGSSTLDAPQHIVIAGNEVTGTNDGGLGIVGIAKHVVFSHNVVTGTTSGDGIAAYNRDNFNVTAVGNVIDGTNNHGIHLGGNRLAVVGNVIYNVNYNAVAIWSDPNNIPTASTQFVVTGNQIDSPGRALDSANGSGVYAINFTGGTITGNQITAPYGYGISAEGCTGITVSGNHTKGSVASHGIRIYQTQKFTVTGNTSESNFLQGIIATDASVVPLTDTGVVSGNTSTGNSGYGIAIGGSADHIKVSGNLCLSNATGAFSFNTSTHISSSGNMNDDSATVAAATSVVLPPHDVIHISNGGTITSVNSNSTVADRQITLVFDGISTVSDSGNIRLAGAFTSTADDTLTLACDGTNWYEIARSVN